MQSDKIIFEMVHLRGVTSFYQPMYGYFNNESRFTDAGKDLFFEKMKSKSEAFNKRFELIKNYIPINSNCLEYGCNIGYNTFLASEIEGVSVTGVDKDRRVIPIAKLLLEYNNLDNIKFIQAECKKYLESKVDGFYDCIICLLVGHHILKNEFTKNLPQSYSELDDVSDKSKKYLKLFLDFIGVLKNKSKRFIVQLRLGVDGEYFSKEDMDYFSYKDDFFIDYLNDYFSFSNIIRIPATPHSFASPHPIYIFDS